MEERRRKSISRGRRSSCPHEQGNRNTEDDFKSEIRNQKNYKKQLQREIDDYKNLINDEKNRLEEALRLEKEPLNIKEIEFTDDELQFLNERPNYSAMAKEIHKAFIITSEIASKKIENLSSEAKLLDDKLENAFKRADDVLESFVQAEENKLERLLK
uniref:Uncharacterized protein n=1 Tax=Romanomermis culicivorax TaxID=13658 RepID=A0A915J7P2_ROMCU